MNGCFIGASKPRLSQPVNNSTFVPLKPVAGRFIVKFKSSGNASVDAAADEVLKDKGRIRHRYRGLFRGMAFDLPEGVSETVRQKLLQKIKQRADVEYIVPDYEVRKYGAAGG